MLALFFVALAAFLVGDSDVILVFPNTVFDTVQNLAYLVRRDIRHDDGKCCVREVQRRAVVPLRRESIPPICIVPPRQLLTLYLDTIPWKWCRSCDKREYFKVSWKLIDSHNALAPNFHESSSSLGENQRRCFKGLVRGDEDLIANIKMIQSPPLFTGTPVTP